MHQKAGLVSLRVVKIGDRKPRKGRGVVTLPEAGLWRWM
jgi:hypothetical protein